MQVYVNCAKSRNICAKNRNICAIKSQFLLVLLFTQVKQKQLADANYF